MKTETEIFIFAIVIFIWLLSVWEALSRLSRGKVRRILAKNKSLAEKAEEWLDHRPDYFIVLRILTCCVLAAMAVVSFIVIKDLQEKTSSALSAVAWTVLVIFAATIVTDFFAKIAALNFDQLLLKINMPVIRGLRYSFFFPFVFIIKLIEDRFEEWQQQQKDQDQEKTTTEDEIMSWVEQDHEGDGPSPLEEDEKRMIRGIFDLDDTPVREIMTPRVDVIGLNLETTGVEEARKTFVESGHSRIPVFIESIDEIKGIIYAKDFLDQENISNKKLDELCHKPLFIPETKPVADLLDEIKKSSNHFAVVIDEYGGTSGIITFEDIIEEIVGEIRDEYDDEEDVENEPVNMPDGSIVLDARTLICDVNDLLEDAELPEDEDVDTIGGLVCGNFGRIPEAGEEITINNCVKVNILKADKRKILTLKIKELISPDD